jgi:hypothetical protein
MPSYLQLGVTGTSSSVIFIKLWLSDWLRSFGDGSVFIPHFCLHLPLAACGVKELTAPSLVVLLVLPLVVVAAATATAVVVFPLSLGQAIVGS